jgi:hypothetical protein
MTFLMTCSCSLFHRISAQNYGADVSFIKIISAVLDHVRFRG